MTSKADLERELRAVPPLQPIKVYDSLERVICYIGDFPDMRALTDAIWALWEKEFPVRCKALNLAWHRGDEGSPDVPVLQPRYDALRAQRDEEAWMHAACLSIAEGVQGWQDCVEQSPAISAVKALRVEVERLLGERDQLQETLVQIVKDLNFTQVVWAKQMADELRAHPALAPPVAKPKTDK